MLHNKTINAPTIYKTAIKGTTDSETFEILFIPPKVTKATITVITIAVIHNGTLKVSFNPEAIELTCAKVPIPKKATPTPKTAKIFASHFSPKPFSM